MNTRIWPSLAAALCLALGSWPASAVNYTITPVEEVVTATTVFPDFGASINDSGTVTYVKIVTGAQQDLLSKTLAGAPVTLISNGLFDSIPVINDAGTVAIAFDDGISTTGVYNATAGSFIYDSTAGVLETYSLVDINSSGNVSFVADYISGAGSAVSTATPLNTINDTSAGSALASITGTSLNDAGVAAYRAPLVAGNVSVFTSASATAVDTLADVFSVAINNNGVVTYNDVNNILANGAVLLASGGTFSSFSEVALNNNNTLAILGNVAGNVAVYARSGPVLDKIIAAGDTISGTNTVAAVDIGPNAINDQGQVVFWAQSFNTSFQLVEGLYIATPDFLLGDINVDGKIDVADNLLMNQFLLGIKTPSVAETNAADMNQDAALTLADLVLHTRNILGQIF